MQIRCFGCMQVTEAAYGVCPFCGYVFDSPEREPYHMAPGMMLRKYQIGRVLGHGGFGVTYLAYDTQLDLRVAIKEYFPAELATRMPGDTTLTVYSGDRVRQFMEGRAKFLEEAQRLAQFSTVPGIVKIYDAFLENETCYIIMEYLEGRTLKALLETNGPMPLEQALTMMTPVLDALQVVHTTGIIHRDISPDNIFLTNDGRVKLLDFGAARYASAAQSKSLSVILKPGYAPEEQYRSHSDQGPWSDVYACAATIYKMITGITPEDAMERVVRDNVQPPSALGIKISKNAENALMNAMNIYKDNRTQSVAELKTQLTGTVGVRKRGNTHKNADNGSWKPWHKALLTVIICLGAGLFTFSAIAISMQRSPMGMLLNLSGTKVPDVLGMDKAEAMQKITATDLIYNDDTGIIYNESIAAGLVMNQYPGAGQKVEKDTEVLVYVSAGERPLTMPNVIGMNMLEAQELLLDAGFENISIEGDDTIVIAQNPLANEECTKDALITLTLAEIVSDEVEYTLIVPKLVGLNYTEIVKGNVKFFENTGFLIVTRQIEPDDPLNKDVRTSGIVLKIESDGKEVKGGDRLKVKRKGDEKPTLVLYLSNPPIYSAQPDSPQVAEWYDPPVTTKDTSYTGRVIPQTTSRSSRTTTTKAPATTTTTTTTTAAPVTDPPVNQREWQALSNSNIKWLLDGDVLYIKGSGYMPDMVTYNQPWGQNMSEVVMEGNILGIGACAFAECMALKSVTMPDTIMEIGDNAFQNCVSLKEIVLSEDLRRIGANALDCCYGLEGTLVLPSGVREIGENAFSNTPGLRDIYVPLSADILHREAFNTGDQNITIHYEGDITQWQAAKNSYPSENRYLDDYDVKFNDYPY